MDLTFVKLVDCEYEQVDKSSAPCHNPPVWLERTTGFAVCEAHRSSLAVFLDERYSTAYANELIEAEIHTSNEDPSPIQARTPVSA